MENNEIKQEELYQDKNGEFINEAELNNIHLDLNHNFPYPKMNSDIISIHHNDP